MQLVGYEPSGRGSALLVSDADAEIDARPLEAGDDLAYSLGERHCAGTIDESGVHVACDRPSAPHCEYHTSTWVCARCTGTCLKDEMDCYEDHAVYIAAFAPDTFKVGVTKRRRLETRLREQGADRGAHVHTVSNGRIARELEAEIAERLVDRVRTPAKVASLAATVDEAGWKSVLAEFDVIDRYRFDYGLGLEARPVRETIASGTVVGVKGRLLVLETGGTAYAVDMRDLVGYDLEGGRPDRNLQSSLGSFGT
ncbi:DUF2797 domain-containing protein [Natrinema thermotolerans]|uniref:DUF2797 domain-containing protein n=1 Tax=Natrinema thermotolerans TaxID=121872 RepID=A0AAF0PB65_9EURY|nr:DUF2797 domain-containing protein [Natrinema thermotolerans]ELZ14116.1 hypothetical protein C478_07589 [Natrinema thermotolerans DSM 11552]QCC57784.1 DUF2797 domain-containing protein [Natrinema thermotolerans]WMT08873.1 DUF2797 domain-containing protein [Natrinema thermotolerans]